MRINKFNDTGASHLPILRAIGQVLYIQKVLEFGCGYYSTSKFLNREWFPHLELLRSYENNPLWFSTILSSTKDPRLQPANNIQIALKDINSFDIIFIDNGKNVEERVETLKVVNKLQPSGLIIIHDFQTTDYQKVVSDFENVYEIKDYPPTTGLVWNGNVISDDRLASIQNTSIKERGCLFNE